MKKEITVKTKKTIVLCDWCGLEMHGTIVTEMHEQCSTLAIAAALKAVPMEKRELPQNDCRDCGKVYPFNEGEWGRCADCTKKKEDEMRGAEKA